MERFRDIKTLQKFASVHASIHNHFNHQRHLNRRDIFKQDRDAALAETLNQRPKSMVVPPTPVAIRKDTFGTLAVTIHGTITTNTSELR